VHSHDVALESYKRTCDSIWKDKSLEPDDRAAAVEDMGPPPDPPLNPMLLIEEPTLEGLQKFLMYGWPAPGLFSDEGGRLLGSFAMSADNQLKTAAGLSSLWDGKTITRVRSGEGTVHMPGRRLSVHLMIQPAVADQLFGNQLLMSQGLLSRLLVAYPPSTIGRRLFRDESVRDHAAARQYFARMMSILEHPLPLTEGSQNQLEPRVVTLDQLAKATWIDYHNHIEVQCGEDGELHAVKGLAAKAAEQAARIALVLALVEDINTGVIQPWHMDAGIELSQFYVGEALRLFDVAELDAGLYQARQLLAWAHAREDQAWPLRELYSKGPKRIRTKQATLAALRILEEHGWVEQLGDSWSFRR
jgi:hypothetical protein